MFGFIYAVVAYVGFLATFVYLALFSGGVGVPKSVDGGIATGTAATLAVDLGLILLFGLQHSVMARSSFKRAITRIIPESTERATYVLASSVALVVLMWQWRPLPAVLWHVPNPGVAAGLRVVNALGWLGVPVSSLMIDHLDLFGLKQAWNGFRRASYQRKGFVTPLFYRYVRHPIMTGVLVGLWVTPQMTVGHLLLSAGMSIYIVIGVHFEERSLIEELGVAYERYMASTPRFLPVGAPKEAQTEAALTGPSTRGTP